MTVLVRLLVALVGTVLLAACDLRPGTRDVLSGPAAAKPFGVASASVADGVVFAGEEIVVRFTEDVDPATLGRRSVRLVGAEGRRAAPCAAVVEGASLRLVPETPGGFRAGQRLRLRIEGGASPRALRSVSGAVLRERVEFPFDVAASPVADLEGPHLVGSDPPDGAVDVTPGAPLELRFSEPIAAGSALSGDAVTLRVDGTVVPARLRVSADGRRVVVRPAARLGPGVAVEAEIHPCVLDRAGNPLRAGSQRVVGFRMRRSSLHEIVEEFVCDDMADPEATDCSWGGPSSPGFLVPRSAPFALGPSGGRLSGDLGPRDVVRFLLLLRGDDDAARVASGLRLRFVDVPVEGPLAAATVDGGAYDLESLEPSFEASLRSARLARLADAAGPFSWEEADGHVAADVFFSEPLRLEPGVSYLFDVTLRPAPGARIASTSTRVRRTLVEGGAREGQAPAVTLLATGAAPGARSRWYDTGVARPRWGAPQWTLDAEDGGAHVTVEFQSAPADSSGAPAEHLAGDWTRELPRLSRERFVRFRVRFGDATEPDRPSRIDRIVIPYVAETP